MIAFKVSLNFDLAKEILKIQCHIYILIKKVIIPWKIQAAMKAFTPPFFNCFNFSLNRKKTCDDEKETTEAVVHRYSSK